MCGGVFIGSSYWSGEKRSVPSRAVSVDLHFIRDPLLRGLILIWKRGQLLSKVGQKINALAASA